MKLEVGKKYKTRNGELAEVVYVDNAELFRPVVARIDGMLISYTMTGRLHMTPTQSSLDLLEEVKPTKRIKGWVGAYRDMNPRAAILVMTDLYRTREDLEVLLDHGCELAHIFEIDVEAEEV